MRWSCEILGEEGNRLGAIGCVEYAVLNVGQRSAFPNLKIGLNQLQFASQWTEAWAWLTTLMQFVATPLVHQSFCVISPDRCRHKLVCVYELPDA